MPLIKQPVEVTHIETTTARTAKWMDDRVGTYPSTTCDCKAARVQYEVRRFARPATLDLWDIMNNLATVQPGMAAYDHFSALTSFKF